MGKQIEVDSLKKEHETLFEKCNVLAIEIVHQINHLIKLSDIQLAFPIQHRPKTWNSIFNKIEQGRYNIKKSITELQDLIGIRFVLLFQRDVHKITNLIEGNFQIIKKYNPEEKLEDNQFGYSSVHVVAKLSQHWLKLPTLSNYENYLIEFQIRTLSQHSWAEASNFLQYKQEDNVPYPLKRSIGRISAILETIDLEYERLLDQREKYKESVKQVDTTDDNINLNVDILADVLDKNLPSANKRKIEPYSELLTELKYFGFESKNKLTKLITENVAYALEEDKKRAGKREAYFTHVGLTRIILRKVIDKVKYDEYIKHKFKKGENK